MQYSSSAFLLFIAAVMCGGAGFIADGGCGEAFAYLVAFLIAAIIAFTLKTKEPAVSTPASSQKLNLKKGDKVNLTKNYPISKIVVGLGWSVNSETGADFDLDASAFLLTANNKVTSNSDFVFYSQRVHPSGAVEHKKKHTKPEKLKATKKRLKSTKQNSENRQRNF